MRRRILFGSCHGYIDPSNGAATATRDLLALLAARGHDCRVLSTGVFDLPQEVRLEEMLAREGIDAREVEAALDRGGMARVSDCSIDGVRVTIVPTSSSRIERSPDPDESGVFLDLFDQVLRRFRPEVVWTYGGHPTNIRLMQVSRDRGVPVVFHLHNLNYMRIETFADASVVIVPTRFARDHYAERLGLQTEAIPLPIRPGRVIADHPEPRYVTFVNPTEEKGMLVFATIARVLAARRPEIPMLVVEGRGTAADLARASPGIADLGNIHVMTGARDPRTFYRVSRALVAPSIVENAGLVVREAMANGIPVLASDRGGLPESLGDAGDVFPLPDRCLPGRGATPSADEVEPWVGVIERLWDDPAFEQGRRSLALAASRDFDPDRILGRYEAVLDRIRAD